jgi:hypothetical protein
MAITAAIALALPSARAEIVPVRHRQGAFHTFLALRNLAGDLLATGDLTQTVNRSQVTAQLIFHFTDGSLYEEKTVFSQGRGLRLVSDHMVQKGPSFPHPIDFSLTAATGQVTVKTSDNGKEESSSERIRVPEDTVNGMLLPILLNIAADASKTSTGTGPPSSTTGGSDFEVSFVTPAHKPRVVKFAISKGEGPTFSIGASRREALDFTVKTKIGGIAGAVASVIGKQPPDTHVWLSAGPVPGFLRLEGILYEGGPVWRIEPAAIVWP